MNNMKKSHYSSYFSWFLTNQVQVCIWACSVWSAGCVVYQILHSSLYTFQNIQEIVFRNRKNMNPWLRLRSIFSLFLQTISFIFWKVYPDIMQYLHLWPLIVSKNFFNLTLWNNIVVKLNIRIVVIIHLNFTAVNTTRYRKALTVLKLKTIR